MTTEARIPWAQTTAGIVVVNGVVTAVVSAFVTWIINNATSLPWLWIVVTFAGIAVVTFLGLSLFRVRLREVIWRRPWLWIRGLSVTTRAQRAKLLADGYDKRSTEVAKERKHVGQPVWRISLPNRMSGFGSYHWINNHGAGVSDVRLSCDHDLFILHQEAFFPGPMTSGTGKQFNGELTERGRSEGVVFTVDWRDANGDHHSRPVPLTPEDIQNDTEQAIEQARIDGLLQGRKEGRAALQAEIDAERQANASRVPPHWTVIEAVQQDVGPVIQLRLTNAEACGPVSDVQITHDGRAFSFTGTTFAAGPFPGQAMFEGILSDVARRRGADFDVSWVDATDERQYGTATLQGVGSRGIIL